MPGSFDGRKSGRQHHFLQRRRTHRPVVPVVAILDVDPEELAGSNARRSRCRPCRSPRQSRNLHARSILRRTFTEEVTWSSIEPRMTMSNTPLRLL
jgi:hypothetical protein